MSTTIDVIAEIHKERVHQIEDLGFDEAHDDRTGIEGFAYLIQRRMIDLTYQQMAQVAPQRRYLVEAAAMAVAAIEAYDRAAAAHVEHLFTTMKQHEDATNHEGIG